MTIEVLISTMNIENNIEYKKLINKMKIKSNSITINQCPNMQKLIDDNLSGPNKLMSFKDKGLSKSRNLAIKNASSDICVLADDDVDYYENYEKIINDAYKKYPDADIIAFYVNSLNKDRPITAQKEGRIHFLKSLKISSIQITFKRNSIKEANISFDEHFGAGSGIFMSGEENIFLTDCLKKNLKIYYVNKTIANVSNEDSTWFKGFTEEYFETIGACYYRMSKFLHHILYAQYAIRKYKYYKNNVSLINAFKRMYIGKKKYKKLDVI